MKLAAVALLVVGILANSMLAIAEGPVPLRTFMQTAGTQPSAPQNTNAKDQSTSPSNQPAHTHMTPGGKIIAGTGVGFLIIGGVVLVGTAVLSGWASSSDKAKLYGAGGGVMAGGVVLIALGVHRRSAN
jgi:hypothetical protein